jgi:hypothetical protein
MKMQRIALYLLLVVVAVLRRPSHQTAAVVEVPQTPAKPVDLGTRDDWALAGGW